MSQCVGHNVQGSVHRAVDESDLGRAPAHVPGQRRADQRDEAAGAAP